MTKHNQKGFSALLLIIIVIIIGLMSGIGWLIWERVQSSKVITVKTDQTTTNKQNNPSNNNIPDGYVEYKNQDYKIKFAYPKQWGNVSTQVDSEQSHLTVGGGINIYFSGEPNVIAAVRTIDWTHDPNQGHGGVDRAYYLAPTNANSYNFSLSDRTNYKVYKNDADSTMALTPLCQEGGCYAMGLILVKNLSGNINTKGVSFVYSPKIEVQIDATDEANMQNNVNALPWATNFSNSLIQQFTTIEPTISNL